MSILLAVTSYEEAVNVLRSAHAVYGVKGNHANLLTNCEKAKVFFQEATDTERIDAMERDVAAFKQSPQRDPADTWSFIIRGREDQTLRDVLDDGRINGTPCRFTGSGPR